MSGSRNFEQLTAEIPYHRHCYYCYGNVDTTPPSCVLDAHRTNHDCGPQRKSNYRYLSHPIGQKMTTT